MSEDESTLSRLPDSAPMPERIGPYRIREVLGEGGMGTVYLAEQTEPVRRRVALKLIKLGMDTREVIARFDSERQALALMNHPHVAAVYDAGATEQGRPYFAMEFVPGEPITAYCDKHQLSLPERLQLFMQVCHAIQHAHQKGIIHRDIKPSNVLVMYQDGKPVPKVIDFGVAKATNQRLTENTVFTEQGLLIGTPAYMSPEQAEMTTLDIDTRTDVYSLGVLLYELLTGMLPFDPKSLRSAGFAAIQRIIREVEPSKPSTKLSTLDGQPPASAGADIERGNTVRAKACGSLQDIARNRHVNPRTLTRLVRGDLDWITMKSLEKDRTRRYDSASDFAADIQRHLGHEPVVAGPPSVGYRVSKFVRRNRGVVAAAGVIAVVLLAATAVSIGFALSEAEQRRIAVAAESEQSRARQEAEAARAAEAEQRKLAEQREKEATEARTEAQARADELEQVTEFQASMLSKIDAEQMGRGIFADLRDGIREAWEARKNSEEDLDKALASFDALLAGVNATNLALKVVDRHVLSRAVETIEQDFADQPLVRAALQQTVVYTYVGIGLYEPALPLQEAALATRRRVLGDEHPRTLTSINNLGYLLRLMGKLAEAEPYYRQALEGRRRVLGDDHPHTLISINNMGTLLKSMGRNDQAEPYYREALEARRRMLGDDHPRTLTSMSNMGTLLKSMGKNHQAEPYYREALERKRRVLGDDHPDTLVSINNMGFLLQSMGKPAEAEDYYREALEARRRMLGDDHPDTLVSINNMGDLLRDLGRLGEAEALGAEAVERARSSLTGPHWYTGVFLSNYGMTLLKIERYADAEAALLEAHEIIEAALGAEHERATKVIQLLIDLCDTWHEAEPGTGYDTKAAQWRAKLPEENGE